MRGARTGLDSTPAAPQKGGGRQFWRAERRGAQVEKRRSLIL